MSVVFSVSNVNQIKIHQLKTFVSLSPKTLGLFDSFLAFWVKMIPQKNAMSRSTTRYLHIYSGLITYFSLN